MGLADAETAENGSDSKHIVITPVLCAVPNRNPGDPKLVGPIAGIRIQPGTMLHSIYGGADAVEEHFCNYEVNAEYVSRFEAAGLRLAAWGPQGELKAFELPTHRFFVAMLFQPQRARQQPHPVVMVFVKAAAAFAQAYIAGRANA
jgi:CTP synthase (UTP-ammonia lyase)